MQQRHNNIIAQHPIVVGVASDWDSLPTPEIPQAKIKPLQPSIKLIVDVLSYTIV
jgi:hypothetical protein